MGREVGREEIREGGVRSKDRLIRMYILLHLFIRLLALLCISQPAELPGSSVARVHVHTCLECNASAIA